MSVVRDSLIGFAIGDAIGVPIEFEHREKLLKKPVTSMTGYGTYSVPEGVWSDDTSMTLATMDSIIRQKKIDYDDMASCFLDWLNNASYTATNEVFDIGISTRQALLRFHEGNIKAIECGCKNEFENGNGSLMRMLPIALYCFYSDADIYEVVKFSSSITHAHEISIMGCFIYVNYCLYLLKGLDKFTSYNMIKQIDYHKYFSDDIINVYQSILIDNIESYPIDYIKSTGYVKDTLDSVFWVILNSNSYKEAIIGSINLGGDTDTIGAITGSLAGILYGKEAIPVKWLRKMKRLDYLEDMAKKFDKVLIKCKKMSN